MIIVGELGILGFVISLIWFCLLLYYIPKGIIDGIKQYFRQKKIEREAKDLHLEILKEQKERHAREEKLQAECEEVSKYVESVRSRSIH